MEWRVNTSAVQAARLANWVNYKELALEISSSLLPIGILVTPGVGRRREEIASIFTS